MSNPQFASVHIEKNVLWVRVEKAKPDTNEFSQLITNCESIYMNMTTPFVLAMDMRIMDEINIFDAMQWMALFFRVLPITKKLLLCTCLCLNEKLNHGVNEFLKIYNPVKPFYTFHSEKKFLAKIFASHDVRRISY